MPKTNINDILKPGWEKRLKVRKINPNSRKVKRMLADCKREQENSLKRKEVDWSELDKFYITI